MTMSLREQKEAKKQRLVDAAYDLFMQKGFHKTTIDEIVTQANVAKGTFYLYFKDKSDVMQDIVIRISRKVLLDAYEDIKALSDVCFADRIVHFVDNIIEYFKRNSLVLRMIERNFSWPMLQEELMGCTENDRALSAMLDDFFSQPELQGVPRDDIFKALYVIVSMCGTVCYSSILHGQPDTIDNMKPTLYRIIRLAVAPDGTGGKAALS